MKYFGIGLSKTGTRSLCTAFEMLGYSGKHYLAEYEYAKLDQWDFCNDLPISIRYKELDVQYPGSKFIYTPREMNAWLLSCKRHWEKRAGLPGQNWDDYRMDLFGMLEFDRDVFRRVFLQHQDEVLEHFQNRHEDFLVMDVCGGEGWERLCPFLGAPSPDVEFPHLNKTSG